MNVAMKEQTKARSTNTSRDSQATTTTTVLSTPSQTRKRTSGINSTAAIKLLQKHDCPIEMRFD
jgi:activator of HSP90 ATPase